MPMNQRYTFIRPTTGMQEVVAPERWHWIVHYHDGTVFKQFGDDGVFHQISEIRQADVKLFEMHQWTERRPHITIKWEPDYKLIHFYRNIILHAFTTHEVRIRLYCFGYKVNKHTMIMVITPTDNVIIVEDVQTLNFVNSTNYK